MNQNQLKAIWQGVALTGLGCIFIFMIFAFAQWDITPSDWEVGNRVLLGFLWSVLVFAGSVHTGFEVNDRKDE